MNVERQKLVIAEAFGWIEAFPDHGKPHPATKRGGILLPYFWVNKATLKRCVILPDYLNDLNAMHEAEGALSEADRHEYILRLNEIVRGAHPVGNGMFQWENLHATAAQRAEAFLRVIGKWEVLETI